MTVGIICLVAGSLALLCGLCGATGLAIGTAAPGGGGNRDLKPYLDAHAPSWMVVDVVRAVALFLMALLLLPAGVGLLNRQGWARWLVLLAAIIGIPVYLVFGTYTIAKVLPAIQRFNEANAAGKGPGYNTGFRIGFLATFVPSVAFWIFLFTALLIALFTPAASAALRPEKPPREDDNLDDRDNNWDHDDE